MMSGDTDSEKGESYPFHTAHVDGELIAGVLYIGNTGDFYEFQDPDTHSKHALWTDPRTGDEMVYKNALDASVKTCMGGHVRALIPAERWDDFREDYVNASGEDMETWSELATPEEPLKDLALDTRP